MARFCQRCGQCIVSGGALAEVSEPSQRTAVALCADCCWLIRGHLAPLPDVQTTYQARSERPAPAPVRGGLNRDDRLQFADLVGRYPDGAPIRRRSP